MTETTDLVDVGYVTEQLAWFDYITTPGARIGGPKNLTGKQHDQLEAIIDAMPEGVKNVTFFTRVLAWWGCLPGVTWNVGRHAVPGDPTSPLQPLKRTSHYFLEEMFHLDREDIGYRVTEMLLPNLPFFKLARQIEEQINTEPPGDELLEGVQVEPGSQADTGVEQPFPRLVEAAVQVA